MSRKERGNASLKTCVILDAMIAAHVEGLTFTAQGFCLRCGYKLNRHVRAALNAAVSAGYLVKHKTLYSDGHYRMAYAAQLTRKIPGMGI